MLQQNARITNVAQAYEVIKEMNLLAQEVTLMLHTYTGKNRCARAITRHLRLCSEQDFTYGEVRLDLSEPVRGHI